MTYIVQQFADGSVCCWPVAFSDSPENIAQIKRDARALDAAPVVAVVRVKPGWTPPHLRH